MRAALSADTRSGTSPAPTVSPTGAAGATAGASSSTASQPTTGGQIQADPSTNSLIITAPEPQYRQLRAVIDKLDARRAQVYVESLIAEVKADKAAEFGIQWQSPMGNNGDGTVGLLGTNFSIGGTNLVYAGHQGRVRRRCTQHRHQFRQRPTGQRHLRAGLSGALPAVQRDGNIPPRPTC